MQNDEYSTLDKRVSTYPSVIYELRQQNQNLAYFKWMICSFLWINWYHTDSILRSFYPDIKYTSILKTLQQSNNHVLQPVLLWVRQQVRLFPAQLSLICGCPSVCICLQLKALKLWLIFPMIAKTVWLYNIKGQLAKKIKDPIIL